MAPFAVILLLVASACAAGAHMLWGQRWLQLLVFWMISFVACLIVYVTKLQMPFDLPRPAGVPVLECAAVAWILLLVASRLRL